MNNQTNNKPQRAGTTFTPTENADPMADDIFTRNQQQRHAKTFIPESEDILDDSPEPITANNQPEHNHLTLTAKPMKGLKTLAYGLMVLLSLVVITEVISVYEYFNQLHWIAGLSVISLIVFVSAMGMRTIYAYIKDPDNLNALTSFRLQARRLSTGHDFGNSQPFIKQLSVFYQNKPHAVYLAQCLDSLPNHSNDKEVITHINQVFLQKLDQQAIKQITSASLQNATVVAASPWVTLDMLFSLFRNIKMIEQIASVYGIRPSLPNRLKLLKKVIYHVAFVGSSEVLIDQVLEEFGTIGTTGLVSSRLAQGVGAGIYTAKIGLATLQVSRPIEQAVDQQIKLKTLIKPMISQLKNLIIRKNT